MTKHLDNTEFLSVVHELISDTNECIDILKARSETMDATDQELINASITLLKLHIKILVDVAERNATMLEHANKLLELIKNSEES